MIMGQSVASYVTVSSYAGTALEISRAHVRVGHRLLQVVDIPAAYSLLPASEDERVAQDVLLSERPVISA